MQNIYGAICNTNTVHVIIIIKIWSEINSELEYNQYIQQRKFLMKWIGGFIYGRIWTCIRRRWCKRKL